MRENRADERTRTADLLNTSWLTCLSGVVASDRQSPYVSHIFRPAWVVPTPPIVRRLQFLSSFGFSSSIGFLQPQAEFICYRFEILLAQRLRHTVSFVRGLLGRIFHVP